MTTSTTPSAFDLESTEGIARSRKLWGWLLALGIVMVAIGTFVIGWSSLSTVTIAVTWAFGFVLLVTGIVEIVTAFSVGHLRGILVHLLMGVLYAVAGFVLIDRPVEGALVLTKVLSIFLIVGGAFRILWALLQRFPQWGLVLLSGVVSLALGLMLFKSWPVSALWFLGMAFGIELIMNGWTWIMVALGLRRLPAGP